MRRFLVLSLVAILLSSCVAPTPRAPNVAVAPAAGPTHSPPPTEGLAPRPSTPTTRATAVATAEPVDVGTADETAEGEFAASTAAIPARLMAEVEAIRGLTVETEVPFRLLGRDELRERLEAMVAEDLDEQEMQAQGQMLQLLGLLPENADLLALMLVLQESQVSGFYDEDEGAFYLVQEPGEATMGIEDQVTFVHEYAHALQDQHFDLGQYTDGEELGLSEDQMGAVHALAEGEATLVMLLWMFDHLDMGQIAELAAISSELDLEVLAQTPPYLVQSMLFPYEAGILFAQTTFLQSGWEGIDAAWQDLPASTEQILHPQRYPDDEPTVVNLPNDLAKRMGPGWTEVLRDVWGEVDLVLWLDVAGQQVAHQGADGWDGSQYAFLTGNHGRQAFVIEIAWDSAEEAAEGLGALHAALAAQGFRPGSGDRLWANGRSAYLEGDRDKVRAIIANHEDALDAARRALGWQ